MWHRPSWLFWLLYPLLHYSIIWLLYITLFGDGFLHRVSTLKNKQTNIQCRFHFQKKKRSAIFWYDLLNYTEFYPLFFTRHALHQTWNHGFTHMHIHPQPHDIISEVIWTLWPHWAHPVSQAADLLILMRPLGNVEGFVVIRFGHADQSSMKPKATCCLKLTIFGFVVKKWIDFFLAHFVIPVTLDVPFVCAACCCDPYALMWCKHGWCTVMV